MTVDVAFGTLIHVEEPDEEPYFWHEWPGISIGDDSTREDDGTDPKMTIFAGYPKRSFATLSYYDWLHRIPLAHSIHVLCKQRYPNSNDYEWRPLDRALLALIDQLPETGEAIDIDRAVWYKYWSHRAVEEFGDRAVIALW